MRGRRGMRRLMIEDAVVGRGVLKGLERGHVDPVARGEEVSLTSAVDRADAEMGVERVSLREARRFRQQGGSFRLIVVDLRLIEHRIASREKAAALGPVLAVVPRSSGADLLPEDDGRGALALAHLSAERLPVAVGAPDAGRVIRFPAD